MKSLFATSRLRRLWLGHTGVSALLLCLLFPVQLRAQSPRADAFNPAPNKAVNAVAVQADGMTYFGGEFTELAGKPRQYLGRLTADGVLDESFKPAVSATVYALSQQADGMLLVASGQAGAYLARLSPSGAYDASFKPRIDGGSVFGLRVQEDGKILVLGRFNSLGGVPRNQLGRLNPDGTVDTTFDARIAGGFVFGLALQSGGKILVSCSDTTQFGGVVRQGIARLNPDGSLDMGFDPKITSFVNAILPLPDGKIGVAGSFQSVSGQVRKCIARLNADGTLDDGFVIGANATFGANPATIYCLAAQTDGSLVVGGRFFQLEGLQVGDQRRENIGRYTPDGLLDESYNPGASGQASDFQFVVHSLAAHVDGRLIVSGGLTSLGGQPRLRVGRLNPLPAAEQALTVNSGTITWLRDGSSPEVSRTLFDVSSDGGLSWQSLGSGTRIPGGWELEGAAVADTAIVRGRAQLLGDGANASGWVEVFSGAPFILNSPQSLTNVAGTTVILRTYAGGTGPLSYQWLKNGRPLGDNGNIRGATSGALFVSNVLKADEGEYRLVITNALGSVESPILVLGVIDPAIIAQPKALQRDAGQDATLSVQAAGTALEYQWYKSGAELPGATNAILSFSSLVLPDGAVYRARIRNSYGDLTSDEVRLAVNGATLDGSFAPEGGGYRLAIQGDGKIVTGSYSIQRLNVDGKVDTSFTTASIDGGYVAALAIQEDNKVLVGGQFNSLAGQSRNGLGRLNADGSVDTGFNPLSGGVSALAVLPDGKILVGGGFSSLGGPPRTNLARFCSDGTVDAGFNAGTIGSVGAFALQEDGKVIVSEFFRGQGGQFKPRLVRLLADGSPDSGFANPQGLSDWAAITVQPDGSILLMDSFTKIAGLSRNNIARFHPDGTLDESFDPNAGDIRSISRFALALQTDGKILIGGGFGSLGGQVRKAVGRLNADGSIDFGFNPGVGGDDPFLESLVTTLVIQADGKTLVGGSFLGLAGNPRVTFGRLNSTGSATQNLDYSDSIVTWQRGGTSPEVAWTRFDYSVDGTVWQNLGTGRRIPGGWQLAGQSLPAGGTIRARGQLSGNGGASGGWVETLLVMGSPLITTHPVSSTNLAGATATFSVTLQGVGTANYQWFKGGQPLADVGNISGATTSKLTVGDLKGADAGEYRVMVGNVQGSTPSQIATLTVIDPVITAQPLSQEREIGQDVAFTVAAAGTALNFQWTKDGEELPLATNAVLALTGIQTTDAGVYQVLVSSPYGSVLSDPALLTINQATLDATFKPGFVGRVAVIATQADGKILLGGDIRALGGLPRENLGRLEPDGTVDVGFNPGADSSVNALEVQTDGGILVAGTFDMLAGQPRPRLGRLKPDGILDAAFTPEIDDTFDRVNALAVQPDGKFLAGGLFVSYSEETESETQTGLVRFNPDGSRDATFSAEIDGEVSALALQPDGKMLVAGSFSSVGGQLIYAFARLNPDGSFDEAFHPDPVDIEVGSMLAVQADGKILLGASWRDSEEEFHAGVRRLNVDGTLDAEFVAEQAGLNAFFWLGSLAIQTDGKILIGGGFDVLEGRPRASLGRINTDGSLDLGFSPSIGFFGGVGTIVNSLLIQPDGKILLGGFFADLNGQSSTNLGRLNNTAPATQTLSYDAGNATWLRGGSSPEISRAFFEYSLDGVAWQNLGTANRISGGWRLANLALPAQGRLRARGQIIGAGKNSGGWVEATSELGTVTLNHPPVFTDPISDLALSEQVALVLTNAPTDSDLPVQTVTVSLTSPAGLNGATYDPTTGVFRWTPTEADGPGAYDFALVATDNGTPPLSATNTFRVTVAEVNREPAFAAPIGDLVTPKQVALVLTNAPADSDLPVQTLTVSLTSSAGLNGATYDLATGVFRWTPTEADGPGAYDFALVVTDDGQPSLSATNAFRITVVEGNKAPRFLSPIADLTWAEQVELVLTNVPVDLDQPLQAMTATLVTPSGVIGAHYDAATGIFRWTPGELDGPGSYDFALVITDDGQPSLSATNNFRIAVSEINRPPAFIAPGQSRGRPGDQLQIPITATDPDIVENGRTNRITFGATAMPVGAVLNRESGLLTWTIPSDAPTGTNIVRVTASDDGQPPLSADIELQWVVDPPLITEVSVENLQWVQDSGSMTFQLELPPSTAYVVEWKEQLDTGTWVVVSAGSASTGLTSVVVAVPVGAQGFLRVRLP